ncbi:MAG: hypothetical protein ACO32I_04700 [Candidatus Limnocylindrus sp.]
MSDYDKYLVVCALVHEWFEDYLADKNMYVIEVTYMGDGMFGADCEGGEAFVLFINDLDAIKAAGDARGDELTRVIAGAVKVERVL